MALLDHLLAFTGRGRLMRVYGRSVLSYSTWKKAINALRTETAFRLRRVHTPARPYLLFIEPVYACNLHCPLCARESFRGARLHDSKVLPLGVLDKVLDELGDYLYQCHIFGLGEPTLNWAHTHEVIRRVHRRGIFTLLSTNATMIDGSLADQMIRSPLDYIVCAIDGLSQESYGRYRVGGCFADAMRGLELLVHARRQQRRGVGIEWQFLVNRYNISEMRDARKVARRLGVQLRFSCLGGSGSSPQAQAYWLPPRDSRHVIHEKPGQPHNRFHCQWLWRGAVLNSNGYVARCPAYQNAAQLGSVARGAFMDLYNGPSSQRSRQLYVKGPVPDGPFPHPCNTCSNYTRYHGGPYLEEEQTFGARFRRGAGGSVAGAGAIAKADDPLTAMGPTAQS